MNGEVPQGEDWASHAPRLGAVVGVRVETMRLLLAVTCLAVGLSGGGAGAQDSARVSTASQLAQLHRVDLLPRYRTGSVVAQVSSYDRTGGNDDGFAGTYSFVREEGGHRVLAELEGPGVVVRIWTPTPTDRMLAFYFDGESAPRLRLPFEQLFSGDIQPFVRPVVGNEVGGYTSYVPLPYAHSLKIVYEGDDIRFHQIQYRTFPAGTEVTSFTLPLDGTAQRELDQVAEAWGETGRRPFGDRDLAVDEKAFVVEPGSSARLFRRRRGGRIVGLEIEWAQGSPPRGAGVLLEARWDGDRAPAVLAPVNDLFGYAFGAPAAESFLLGSRAGIDYVYLPMPFDRSAALDLRVLESEPSAARGTARIFWTDAARDPDAEGRLYATWRRERDPEEGSPYLLLDAQGPGHLAGVVLQAQGLEPGMTQFFEGDDVTTVDGEVLLHGTGSEDFFNGGWYAILDRWDRGMSLPLHGALDYSLPLSRTGGYRFYLTDKVPFEERIRQTIEHGPEGNAVPVDYTSVVFHYGEEPSPEAMVPTGAPPPRAPPVHEFYPQLMEISLWFRTSASFEDGALAIRAEEAGRVQLDVSALPPGRYRVRLSYRTGPKAAELSVWRRQHQASPWIDARAPEEGRVERAEVGEVELTAQVRSITLRIRSEEGPAELFVDRVILEEVR